MLKRDSMRFAAALLVALAGSVAGPNPALAAAPQHHDQVPGFYRMKVGDLEVTALLDGAAVFDQHWLNGTKATMDGVDQETRISSFHQMRSLVQCLYNPIPRRLRSVHPARVPNGGR